MHHIDGNSGNNDASNLATLCLDHHDLASASGGLTKKLGLEEIKAHKTSWEGRCKTESAAITRNRLNSYVTAYKNPPRIRQAFLSLTSEERSRAGTELRRAIQAEAVHKDLDQGFSWQTVPRTDNQTLGCIESMERGELWPGWLPRVGGHPLDPDYPTDLAPPNGMPAFHVFDLYCQIVVQALMCVRQSVSLEEVVADPALDRMRTFRGILVHWREVAKGKGIKNPGAWEKYPTGILKTVIRRRGTAIEVSVPIKTMYIFSDTAALNLKHARLSGIGILGDAFEDGKRKKSIQLSITPLLLGIGALGEADEHGWYNLV